MDEKGMGEWMNEWMNEWLNEEWIFIDCSTDLQKSLHPNDWSIAGKHRTIKIDIK